MKAATALASIVQLRRHSLPDPGQPPRRRACRSFAFLPAPAVPFARALALASPSLYHRRCLQRRHPQYRTRCRPLAALKPTASAGPSSASAGAPASLLVRPSSARALLVAVTMLWGSFTVVCRLFAAPGCVPALAGTATLPPMLFNALRLGLSAVLSLAVLARGARVSGRLALAGAELGLWTLLVNLSVVSALAYTSAPRAGFLAQLQTLLVPLSSMAMARWGDSRGAAQGPGAVRGARVLPAALVALAGSALLSMDGAGNGVTAAKAAAATLGGTGFPLGDALAVMSSVFATIYVMRSRAFAVKQLPPLQLTAVKTVAQAAFALLHLGAAGGLQNAVVGMGPGGALQAVRTASVGALVLNIGMVAYAGVAVSFFGALLQISSLVHVPAAEAALIFAFSPVVTSALAAVFMREVLGLWGLAGAALILVACITCAVASSQARGS